MGLDALGIPSLDQRDVPFDLELIAETPISKNDGRAMRDDIVVGLYDGKVLPPLGQLVADPPLGEDPRRLERVSTKVGVANIRAIIPDRL